MTDLERAQAAFLAATPDGEVILTMTERAANLMAEARQEGAKEMRERASAVARSHPFDSAEAIARKIDALTSEAPI